jgi:hypothetical protein
MEARQGGDVFGSVHDSPIAAGDAGEQAGFLRGDNVRGAVSSAAADAKPLRSHLKAISGGITLFHPLGCRAGRHYLEWPALPLSNGSRGRRAQAPEASVRRHM